MTSLPSADPETLQEQPQQRSGLSRKRPRPARQHPRRDQLVDGAEHRARRHLRRNVRPETAELYSLVDDLLQELKVVRQLPARDPPEEPPRVPQFDLEHVSKGAVVLQAGEVAFHHHPELLPGVGEGQGVAAGADEERLGMLLEQRREQVFLPPEVQVERAVGHPRALGDLAHAGGEVAAFGEDPDRGAHDRPASAFPRVVRGAPPTQPPAVTERSFSLTDGPRVKQPAVLACAMFAVTGSALENLVNQIAHDVRNHAFTIGLQSEMGLAGRRRRPRFTRTSTRSCVRSTGSPGTSTSCCGSAVRSPSGPRRPRCARPGAGRPLARQPRRRRRHSTFVSRPDAAGRRAAGTPTVRPRLAGAPRQRGEVPRRRRRWWSLVATPRPRGD